MKTVILFYLVFILTNFSSNAFAEDKGGENHCATFIMVHFEVGEDSNFRVFQDILREELKAGYVIDSGQRG